jgi:hypothetical protein
MFSRREILRTVSAGFGYLAFAGLSTMQTRCVLGEDGADDGAVSSHALAPKAPHFTARAKRVIFLCMQGGPSHLDTFDYKPKLGADEGKTGRRGGQLMASPWKFQQRGESGLWISELFPELGKQADSMCLLRSMHCDQPIHPRAMTQMHTGNAQFVRPSLGAWTLYGLGTENENLPGFVALNPQATAVQNYGNAFLPAIYQGTKVGRPQGPRPGLARNIPRDAGDAAVPDISNPRLNRQAQRAQLDFIQQLNQTKLGRDVMEPNVEGVIESYELAFRMQDALPQLMDLGGESEKTLAMYGINENPTDGFGRQCLLARRFVEAGVRFVELNHGNWDHHLRLREQLPTKCSEIDKPIAGLLTDLRQRGLLDQTLVIWGGEFGRTPDAQNGDGRDHNNKGYTTWMAGGGVRGGFSYGATDDHGREAVEDKCHIHDWHATILHLLGLDHERLTYRYAGRNFRLTDVYGEVIKKIST